MKNKPNYAKFIKKPAPLSLSAPEQDTQSAPPARGALDAEKLPFAEVILTPRQRALMGEVYETPDESEASRLAGYASEDPPADTLAYVAPGGLEKPPEASKFTNMIQSLHAGSITGGAPPIAPMAVFVALLIAYMSI